MAKKKEQIKPFELDDRIKLILDDGGPEDLGCSGIVLHSIDGRYGPWKRDTMYYMGELKELPEWCVISTTKNKTSSTKDFMVRKDSIRHAGENEW